jgi:hypothetical protein
VVTRVLAYSEAWLVKAFTGSASRSTKPLVSQFALRKLYPDVFETRYRHLYLCKTDPKLDLCRSMGSLTSSRRFQDAQQDFSRQYPR